MYKLANAADITPAQARQLCDRMRTQLAMGTDIAAERTAQRHCPRVREFFHQHYLPYAKSYKRSWATDVSYYETHINDLIGERHMDSVSKQDVIAVMNKASQRLSPTSSYRLLVLLRYMFNLAIRWNIGSIKVNPTQHRTQIHHPSAVAHRRTQAGLTDVRIHDLRHNFASFLVNAGCSLYEVQKLLGHSSSKMTQRYSHLSQPSLLRAVSFAQDYVKVPPVSI